MSTFFKTRWVVLNKNFVDTTGNNLYVNGLLVGSGTYQATGNYVYYEQLIETGNSAIVHANGIGTILSGNLTQTGLTLISQINSLSGWTNNIVSGGLEARLFQTGNAAVVHSNGVGTIISGNLTTTGATLDSKINSLSGFIGQVSGGIETRIIATGNSAITHANGIGISISGDLTATGQRLFQLASGTSGNLNSLSGFVSNVSGGLEVRIFATGNAAVVHSNGIGSIISGNLTQTGAALINRDLLISGWLTTGIAVSGQAAVNYANSVGVSTSGTIVLTGNAAIAHANGIGQVISGNLSQSGANLLTVIANTGQQAVNYANGVGLNLSGNLTLTGQTLYQLASGTSGNVNSLSGFVGLVSGGLEVRITSTGNSVVTHANGIGINLSGNLTQTGITLLTKINSLSGHVDNVSGALQAQIAGGGSQVKVTGSATIAIPDFTGIGGVAVLYSGSQVFISGGAGGGGVSQGQLDSLSGYSDSIFIHRTGEELISGIKTFNTGVIISGDLTQGSGNIALGIYSHAEGFSTITSGAYSHAEGFKTSTSGLYSHAEGGNTIATGVYSHSEGSSSIAGGFASHAEGGDGHAIGRYSHTEGRLTIASGENSHAEGYESQANGLSSHSEGNQTKAENTYSHAEGNRTIAYGVGSHSEGFTTKASGDYSHSEGNTTRALSSYAHAEGTSTMASGEASHAEGNTTRAIGNWSHAEGSQTAASGIYSHAEGFLTITTGSYSHAEGVRSAALGTYSHAEGVFTVADRDFAHAQGMYNRSGVSGLFQVGRGTSESDRRDVIYISDTEANLSILSGEWIASATGINDLTIVNYGRLTGISGALQSQLGGGGSQVRVSGSSNIPIADFTGIGGTIVLYSGGQIFISGGSSGPGGGSEVKVTGSSSLSIADFTGISGIDITRDGDIVSIYPKTLAYRTGDADIVISATLNQGQSNIVLGAFSHAEGILTIASGEGSHAEGLQTSSSGLYSHAEGSGTYAMGFASHAEGGETKASGLYSHTEGWFSRAFGRGSHGEGFSALAYGDYSHAEGNVGVAWGDSSHAEGYYTVSSGNFGSHSEGWSTLTKGLGDHAEGYNTFSSGFASHAEGYETQSSREASHAEGRSTKAFGNHSHAEGNSTTTIGIASHAEGYFTLATGNYSHAEGHNSVASGVGSHAQGFNNIAASDYSLVAGMWATINNSGLFQIGRGTAENRTDALFISSGSGWQDPSILSGEWITSSTGVNGLTVVNFNRLVDTSGALLAQLGGGGSQVQITGSSTLSTANFTGIGGANVLYSGSQVFVDTREVVQPLRVPFVTTAVTATNATLAPQFFGNSFGYVTFENLSRYTGIRFVVTKVTTAGAANSAIFLRYLGNPSTTASQYLPITSPEMRIPTNNTNTVTVSGFWPIVDAAKSGVYLAVILSGGDGVLDPVFGNISASFL